MQHSLFYDWKPHLKKCGRGGAIKPWEEKGDLMITTVFVEQLLASPRSASSLGHLPMSTVVTHALQYEVH